MCELIHGESCPILGYEKLPVGLLCAIALLFVLYRTIRRCFSEVVVV